MFEDLVVVTSMIVWHFHILLHHLWLLILVCNFNVSSGHKVFPMGICLSTARTKLMAETMLELRLEVGPCLEGLKRLKIEDKMASRYICIYIYTHIYIFTVYILYDVGMSYHRSVDVCLFFFGNLPMVLEENLPTLSHELKFSIGICASFQDWWQNPRCFWRLVGEVFKEKMWGFPRIGVPQNGWFIMENPITIFGNIHVKDTCQT